MFEIMTITGEASSRVRLVSRALEYVPEALKTPELCLAAVQNDWRALFQEI